MSGFWRGAVTAFALLVIVAGVYWACLVQPPQIEPTEMREVSIEVDFRLKPKIPFVKVPVTADPNNPGVNVRRVTFKTDKGTATVIIPVEGKVTYPNSEQVSLPSGITVLDVDEYGATLEITEQNKEEIEVEYQILCDDGTNRYWAEGQSPPRIIIPKW